MSSLLAECFPFLSKSTRSSTLDDPSHRKLLNSPGDASSANVATISQPDCVFCDVTPEKGFRIVGQASLRLMYCYPKSSLKADATLDSLVDPGLDSFQR